MCVLGACLFLCLLQWNENSIKAGTLSTFIYSFVPVPKIFSRNICGMKKFVSSRLLINVCLIKSLKTWSIFPWIKNHIFVFCDPFQSAVMFSDDSTHFLILFQFWVQIFTLTSKDLFMTAIIWTNHSNIRKWNIITKHNIPLYVLFVSLSPSTRNNAKGQIFSVLLVLLLISFHWFTP